MDLVQHSEGLGAITPTSSQQSEPTLLMPGVPDLQFSRSSVRRQVARIPHAEFSVFS
jgi:hypothetical protein